MLLLRRAHGRFLWIDHGPGAKDALGERSAKGNLNFNWKLVLMPEEILDYVVVHELAHRLQMNHSTEFWDEVEKILPDYRKRRQWLKENGQKY